MKEENLEKVKTKFITSIFNGKLKKVTLQSYSCYDIMPT